MLNLTTVLAAALGAAFTAFGFWAAAVADRIRYRRLDREFLEMRSAPSVPVPESPRARRAAPARRPQRDVAPPAVHAARSARPPVKSPRMDEVAEWLENMGYPANVAAIASQRVALSIPDAPLEERIRAALRYCPAEN